MCAQLQLYTEAAERRRGWQTTMPTPAGCSSASSGRLVGYAQIPRLLKISSSQRVSLRSAERIITGDFGSPRAIARK